MSSSSSNRPWARQNGEELMMFPNVVTTRRYIIVIPQSDDNDSMMDTATTWGNSFLRKTLVEMMATLVGTTCFVSPAVLMLAKGRHREPRGRRTRALLISKAKL